ncbi:MAG: selenocysteine-specific translation elongation factor, partial [Chloroflexi bacterium]|nr:selenocysteine-specific translation elongation factor [Chloroflexota bacterium]
MFVAGTAGHVDHGKSTLIEKLTGIDPDRLGVEKARGMTIELGFAWLDLDDGREISIVDVPGHERFVRTMLMGAGGFDLALLVVAGDEGPMPQTREHLAILDLLEVEDGIVVITKSDLADDELIELIEIEVSEILEGTSLEGSPTIAVSADTGDGLNELRGMITEIANDKEPRTDAGRPRLFVDRSFSVAGFGAVVTGTLDGGNLAVGDEVDLLPSGETARIRGLQSHKSEVEIAQPGTRVAASLSGVSHTEIERGEALVKRGQFTTTVVFDASIRSIADAKRPIKHNHHVTLYGGTWEEPATVRLLDRDELKSGERGWAQVKMSNPRPITLGDRFVVRDSNDTLGGGVALVVDAPRHRRNDRDVVEQLTILSEGKSEDVVFHSIDALGIANRKQIIDATHMLPSEMEADIGSLVSEGRLIQLTQGANPLYTTQTRHESMLKSSLEALKEYHQRYPLRRGMPREELRNRLTLAGSSFDAVAACFSDDDLIAQDGHTIRLIEHAVQFSADQKREVDRYLDVLREHRYSPPAWNKIDDELLGALADRREVVNAGPDVVFAADAYDEM